MLTWMAKEPMVRNAGMRAGAPGPGGGMVVMGGGGQAMTPEERAQMMKDLDAQMKEAEAKRRVVEFQMTYGDYKAVNGVKMPTRLRRTIDGKNTDELVLEKITLNAKIDPKKFDTVK
jgi:outer membrane lipoprotein-sorting protein